MKAMIERIRAHLGLYVTVSLLILFGVVLGVFAERNAGERLAAANGSISTVHQAADVAAAERRARGPRGKRGKRGPEGPRGYPGDSGERVIQLGVDWDGSDNAVGHDTDSVVLPGIGELALTCPASDGTAFPGPRKLTLTYGAAPGYRTVATLNTLQASDMYPDNVNNQRQETTGATIEFGLPNNGMVTGTFSAETVSGDGSAAGALPGAQITMSSSWKTNDPDNAQNFCHLSAQVIAEGV